MIKINSEEQNKGKRKKTIEDSLKTFGTILNASTFKLQGVTEEEEKQKGTEKIIEEIILENFPNIGKQVQQLSRVRLFATPWTAESQASLSITNSQILLKLMSIESVMPSNYLILCHPLLLLPSIFPSIRVFSNESVLCIRWPKY